MGVRLSESTVPAGVSVHSARCIVPALLCPASLYYMGETLARIFAGTPSKCCFAPRLNTMRDPIYLGWCTFPPRLNTHGSVGCTLLDTETPLFSRARTITLRLCGPYHGLLLPWATYTVGYKMPLLFSLSVLCKGDRCSAHRRGVSDPAPRTQW